MGLNQFIFKTLLLTFLIGCSESVDCGTCQTNGAACYNETSFYLCYGDMRPHTSQIFTCNDGLVCTSLPSICFQSGGWASTCGDLSKCGVCNQQYVFACTSRRTFAFCFGATTASEVLGTCPAGYVCDYLSNEICVPHNQATLIGCDIDAPLLR